MMVQNFGFIQKLNFALASAFDVASLSVTRTFQAAKKILNAVSVLMKISESQALAMCFRFVK